ncbi:MAG: signal peptidase II [Acidimicrobiia bacterium]
MIRRYILGIAVAVAVVAVDLATKRYAAVRFKSDPVTVIPGLLRFSYTENSGAAFSLFQGAGPLIGLIAIGVALGILWTLRLERHPVDTVALALILGGALGNLADRIFRGDGFLDGLVIDWIVLWRIPTFNLADTSIFTAVVLLLIASWKSDST